MNAQVKAWGLDTAKRAVKTFAQTLVALLGAHAVNVVNVPWGVDLGTAAFAAVVCVLQNVQTLPDLDTQPAPSQAVSPAVVEAKHASAPAASAEPVQDDA